MRRVLPLLLLAALCLAFAPAPLPRRPKPDDAADLKALQGEWVLVRYSLNGGAFRDEDSREAVFDGDRLSRRMCGMELAKWVVTLDPSSRPKRMDMKAADAQGRTFVPHHTLRCIYKLDGDTLTYACRNAANAPERPTDFNPHELMCVQVFRRQKQ